MKIISSSWRLPFLMSVRNLNCNRSWIGKIKRSKYTRTYPTMLVLPDGSTVNIRYDEPRAIIKLPLNLSTLSEEERKARLLKRQPKVVRHVEEEIEDDFAVDKYQHLWKQ